MLNIKKSLQEKLSATSYQLSAFRKLTANSSKLKANLGFTLIELLVVIAIIGILSSVVLSSLNSARDKGSDVAIKADLSNIKNQALIYFDDNGNYGDDVQTADDCASGMFSADSIISGAITAAKTMSGPTSVATCFADDESSDVNTASATSWAVSVPLKSNPLQSWCIDSSGVSMEITGTALITGANVASCQ